MEEGKIKREVSGKDSGWLKQSLEESMLSQWKIDVNGSQNLY